jgi:hypothetical protein
MNHALMLQVADYIEAHPEEFSMFTFGEPASWASSSPTCETVGCIGGTAVHIADPDVFREWALGGAWRGPGESISEYAESLLGLDHGAANHLFYAYWHREGMSAVTPEEAAAHLRELVAADQEAFA